MKEIKTRLITDAAEGAFQKARRNLSVVPFELFAAHSLIAGIPGNESNQLGL
jgi:hypothetical protein